MRKVRRVRMPPWEVPRVKSRGSLRNTSRPAIFIAGGLRIMGGFLVRFVGRQGWMGLWELIDSLFFFCQVADRKWGRCGSSGSIGASSGAV